MEELAELIHTVPDFPTPGILFRDITPLLLAPGALERVTDLLTELVRDQEVDSIAAIESRGFIFGAPLAVRLTCGLIPVRKTGKLPRSTCSRRYALEYGTNHLEMHDDAVRPGDRVLIIDDVLATGGTARATAEIIEELGGTVVAALFLLELEGLGGRSVLEGWEVHSLLRY